MNLFGPKLGEMLDHHRISRQELADGCGIHRNQLTNITKGKVPHPNNIGIIFSVLRAKISEEQLLALAVYYLEDCRAEIDLDSTAVTIEALNAQVTNEPRRRLLALYDTNSDVRTAIDAVIDVIDPLVLGAKKAWGTKTHMPEQCVAEPSASYTAKHGPNTQGEEPK